MSIRTDVINLNVNINGDPAKNQLNNLRTEAAKITAEMKLLKKGTAEWVAKNTELSLLNDKMAALRSQIGLTSLSQKELTAELKRLQILKLNLTPQTKEFNELQTQINAVSERLRDVRAGEFGFKKFLSNISTEVKQFGMLAAGYLGFDFLIGQTKNVIQMQSKMADEYANISKTTSLTAEEIKTLDVELRKLNTRSSNSRLRELAAEAGKLGKDGVADIQAFVKEADMIDVALGEDLGEEGLNKIAKLSGILKVGMLNIASGINAVGAASAASEGYQVDFAFRMAGTAQTARIAAGDLLGFASALEVNGQTAEVSGTALSTFMLGFIKNTETFGQAAGMAKGELMEMVNGQGVNEAFLSWLQKMKDTSKGQDDFLRKMEGLGIDGARGAGVFLVLANNIEQVREQQLLANSAVEEGTSVLSEFETKNNNFAATVDKLKKSVAGFFTSDTINGAIVSMTNGLIELINGFKGLLEWIGNNSKVVATLTLAFLIQIGAVRKLIVWFALLGTELKGLGVQESLAILRKREAIVLDEIAAIRAAILSGAYSTVRASLLRLTAAMGLNPFTALLIIIGAIALAVSHWTSKMNELTEAQKLSNEVQKAAEDSTRSQIASIETLTRKVNDNSLSLDERRKALEQLIAINPSYLNGLTLENMATYQGTLIIDQYVKALQRKAKAQAIEARMQKLEEEKLEVKSNMALYATNENAAKQEYARQAPVGLTAVSSVIDAARYGTLNSEQAMLKEQGEQQIAALNSKIEQLGGEYRANIEENTRLDSENAHQKSENVKAIDQQMEAWKKQIYVTKKYTSANEDLISSLDQRNAAEKNAPILKKISELGFNRKIAVKASLDAQKTPEDVALATGTAEEEAAKAKAKADAAAAKAKGGKGGKSGKSDAEKAAEKAVKDLESLRAEIEKVADEIAKKSAKAQESLSAEHAFEVQDLTKKYAELIAKAKGHAQEMASVEGLKKKDFDLLLAKQKTEMDTDNYKTSLKTLDTYIASVVQKTKEQYAAGLISRHQYDAQLEQAEADALEGRVSLNEHFADTVKAAADDLEKSKTAVLDKGIKEREKIEADAKRSALAYADYMVAKAPEGSGEQLEALKTRLDLEKEIRLQNEELTQEELLLIQEEYKEKIEELDRNYWKTKADNIISIFQKIGDILSSVFSLIDNKEQAQLNEATARDQKKKKSLERRLASGTISQKKYDTSIAKIDKDADDRSRAFAVAKAKRDKAAAIFGAIINVAQGITASLSQVPPYSFIMAALTGVLGAVQIAAIASQPLPTGRKGLVISGPSHEAGGIDMINSQTGKPIANIEGGEPVMVLSKSTYGNNKEVIDALIESSQYKGGAAIKAPWYMAQQTPLSSRAIEAAGRSSFSSALAERQAQSEQALAQNNILLQQMLIEQQATRQQSAASLREQQTMRNLLAKDRDRRAYVVLQDLEDTQKLRDKAKSLSGIKN